LNGIERQRKLEKPMKSGIEFDGANAGTNENKSKTTQISSTKNGQ
jgi:hypothetical protein